MGLRNVYCNFKKGKVQQNLARIVHDVLNVQQPILVYVYSYAS